MKSLPKELSIEGTTPELCLEPAAGVSSRGVWASRGPRLRTLCCGCVVVALWLVSWRLFQTDDEVGLGPVGNETHFLTQTLTLNPNPFTLDHVGEEIHFACHASNRVTNPRPYVRGIQSRLGDMAFTATGESLVHRKSHWRHGVHLCVEGDQCQDSRFKIQDSRFKYSGLLCVESDQWQVWWIT